MNLSYEMAWLGFRFLFSTYFHWRVFNPERVPTQGPVILACNHESYIDPPLVGAGLRRPLNYLARDNLWRFPVLGWILTSWNVVPVDRDRGGGTGLKGILDRLRAGGAILLFPEGTRSRDGLLQPARAGLGLVIMKSTAPVVPVRVFGTFRAFGRHVLIPRPYGVAVKYGRPINFDALRAEATDCSKLRLKEIYHQGARDVIAAIAALEPKSE